MTLRELCGEGCELTGDGSVSISGITADSRAVSPGSLFVALPKRPEAGFRHDGHDYIADAVGRGAVAIAATDAERARAAAGDLPLLLADDTRRLLPALAARWYGDASRALDLVGVTGTNGKTTTCYLLDAIFQAAGHRTVLVGTVETRIDGEVRPAATTTPDPVSLQALWREAVDRGVGAGAMEVSSHALDQHRVEHTRYAVAIFTNLTQDHLDYHPTMDEYFAAKARLFTAEPRPLAVVNGDDAWGAKLLASGCRDPWSFGLGADHDVRAEEVTYDVQGASFRVVTPRGTWHQTTRLPGPYNVANALGAIAAALRLDIDPAVVAKALTGAKGAPGRLEPVDAGQPFSVLVDYAHTPDALENVLGAVRKLTERRVLCVVGCGGDRDRAKRPLMGGIAARLSDVAVITSDNPRSEEPGAIIDDIVAGVDAMHRERLRVEPDRAAAIGAALAAAQPGDVVVIAGKGHEDYQILRDGRIHFDDREVATAWLEANR